MKNLILPYAAWMGLVSLAAPVVAASDIPRIVATAGVLGSLTVLVYRLGVWRSEMENTRSNVGAELRGWRAESVSNFARMERQLEALNHMITDYVDFKRKASKWRLETLRRLERLEEKTP